MTQFAKLYGGSLFDLAAEEGADGAILDQLEECLSLLRDNTDYLKLLSTPSLPKKERCGLLDQALRGSVHQYLLNFLKILCERGQLGQLSQCAAAYRQKYNQAHGILEATAVSAVALTDDQALRLRQKLESVTGKQIRLRCKVDPAVLGGIRLDIDGTELDGTVQSRLAGLRGAIAAAAL